MAIHRGQNRFRHRDSIRGRRRRIKRKKRGEGRGARGYLCVFERLFHAVSLLVAGRQFRCINKPMHFPVPPRHDVNPI